MPLMISRPMPFCVSQTSRPVPTSALRGLRAVDVEDPHDGNALLDARGDQRVLRGHVGRQVAVGEVRALAERFLGIDQNET
jgi:hypothetical protein